jgi:GNAT superfamily N-acetyltransferase
MYVTPSARRHGIGRGLLTALEQIASKFSYRTLRLETGPRQPQAIALYESHGFRRFPPYGTYASDPLSICFEKNLTP